MAKTNYAYEKRQKEIAKKQKKEEKQQQKSNLPVERPKDVPGQPPANETPADGSVN